MSQKIIEIGKQILSETNLERVLTFAIDKAIDITGAERGLIILFGKDGESIFETARNLNKIDIENPKFEVSRSIINKVKKEKKPVYFKDALEEPEFNASESTWRLKILSVIALPLINQDEIFGVVYLDNRSVRGVFQQDNYTFAQEFAEFISVAAYSALEKKKQLNQYTF
jgi:serine/threonine-protein kinase PknK